MTFVVTENCIKCKYTDCVEVCPVDCFYEGENYLVTAPGARIGCARCEPACPADLSKIWPVITERQEPPADAKDWDGKPDKLKLLER